MSRDRLIDGVAWYTVLKCVRIIIYVGYFSRYIGKHRHTYLYTWVSFHFTDKSPNKNHGVIELIMLCTSMTPRQSHTFDDWFGL